MANVFGKARPALRALPRSVLHMANWQTPVPGIYVCVSIALMTIGQWLRLILFNWLDKGTWLQSHHLSTEREPVSETFSL
jgi:hypothetical protein